MWRKREAKRVLADKQDDGMIEACEKQRAIKWWACLHCYRQSMSGSGIQEGIFRTANAAINLLYFLSLNIQQTVHQSLLSFIHTRIDELVT